MPGVENYATSFNPVNYSGLLFNKGNTNVPLSTIIGGRQKYTNHVEFVTGQDYKTEGGTQPGISEEASLVAPTFTPIGRTQNLNVTQIFHESVGISYGKESNMGTLAGLNVAAQTANPISELDFQAGAKMVKIARDIEYTFINGIYQKSTNDQTPNKTRGLVSAIETNVHDLGGKTLAYWDVVEMMRTIKVAQAPVNNLVVWCDSTSLLQLNADAIANNMTQVPMSWSINGINITTLITPFGNIGIYVGEFLPAGTVMLLNIGVISPVHQPTPDRGNFFLEELAKVGAGTRYQIFGQIGLDHGPEWYHGKITGISTEFVAPVTP